MYIYKIIVHLSLFSVFNISYSGSFNTQDSSSDWQLHL